MSQASGVHHLEGTRAVQESSAPAWRRMRHSRVVIWSSLLRPAMDCLRNERISGAHNRSSANRHPKPEVGADSDHLVGLAKCVAECNFNRRNVRVYRSGTSAQPYVGCLP